MVMTSYLDRSVGGLEWERAETDADQVAEMTERKNCVVLLLVVVVGAESAAGEDVADEVREPKDAHCCYSNEGDNHDVLVLFRKVLDSACRAMEACKADTTVVRAAAEDHDYRWTADVAAVVGTTKEVHDLYVH